MEHAKQKSQTMITQFRVIYVIIDTIQSFNVTNVNYKKLEVDFNPWLCPTCAEEIPFFALAIKDLKNLISNIFPQKSILKKVDQKKFHLAKSKKLNHVLNETENNISCDYFEINEFKEIKIK